jgi:hypothetical protein
MIKYTGLALSVVLAATVASAQMTEEKTVTKEKSISTQSDVNGNVQTKESEVKTKTDANGQTSVKTDKTYTTRLESAYKHAGVAEADIARLREIDLKSYDYVKAGDKDKIKVYYEEQARILKPEQVEKVRVYLREHPAPTGYHVRTTYETYPTGVGVGINTPIGNVGIGVPTGSTTVEKQEVVPNNP